jgi:hypothetical protein
MRVAENSAPCRGLLLSDLRSTVTYATRLCAGGVADEWVTQLLRQGGVLASLQEILADEVSHET